MKLTCRDRFKMLKTICSKLSRIKSYLTGNRSFNVETELNKLNTNNFNLSNTSNRIKNPSLYLLIENFQKYGHLKVTNIDHVLPLEIKSVVDLLSSFPIDFDNLPEFLSTAKSYNDILSTLEKVYCDGIGVEFLHLDNPDESQWFEDRFLNRKTEYAIDSTQKKEYLQLMTKAEELDRFLSKKFQSVKRYSGEGAESSLVCMHEILVSAVRNNISTVIISMAHRTRNNVLTAMLSYPPVLFFRKMMGKSEFPSEITSATGDTFSHYFISSNWRHRDLSLNVSMIPNPSHLEANIPVGAGKARSKMLFYKEGDYSQDSTSRNGDNVLALFAHGDASVFGQGIVPETLVMCNSRNFSIGGSIHIVINNNVGFTTDTPSGLRHVTDVGKIINCPIIHVDGYNVVEVARSAMIAMDYRQKFRKDVFINLQCYRRWGHNELDDPTITQPLMYAKLAGCKSISQTFMDTLIKEKCINSPDEVLKELDKWTTKLNEDLAQAGQYNPEMLTFKKQWNGMKILDRSLISLGIYDTGFNIEHLIEIGKLSVHVPSDFAVHQNVLKSHIQRRAEKMRINDTGNIDWATAEALSLGSLMAEGYNCRISGQDVGRGTFNHRHFSLVDQRTNALTVPFNISPWPKCFTKRGYLEVANSILSEEAVLGFEIGMALDNPDQLCIWEAQFGDFFNGAQILIDTYLGSAETKWLLQNGLVLLLPHGYDGAGPEHSSCRIERFLQLTDSSEINADSDAVNMHVVNPTTPAQYFHVLRRQIIRPFRRPLVVVAPKVLLRSPLAVSSFSELGPGTHFRHILPHENRQADKSVASVLLCSGKHFYTLKQHIETVLPLEQRNRYGLVRVEQLSPFPVTELREELGRYSNCTRFVWCQEEPRNMGAWSFVEARVRNMLGINLNYAGRKELAAPAVGIGELYKEEVAKIMSDAFVQ